jgi:hypothetical protein
LLERVNRALAVSVVFVNRQFHGDHTLTITLLPERRYRPRQYGKADPAEKISSPH